MRKEGRVFVKPNVLLLGLGAAAEGVEEDDARFTREEIDRIWRRSIFLHELEEEQKLTAKRLYGIERLTDATLKRFSVKWHPPTKSLVFPWLGPQSSLKGLKLLTAAFDGQSVTYRESMLPRGARYCNLFGLHLIMPKVWCFVCFSHVECSVGCMRVGPECIFFYHRITLHFVSV